MPVILGIESSCDDTAAAVLVDGHIKSNIISAAINMSKKKQNKHEIFLGTNSRNKFIARWLWYFKKILPSYIGGLRILKK